MNQLSDQPLVYLITDGTATDLTYDADAARVSQIIEAAIAADIPLIQIREKQLSSRNLFNLAKIALSFVRNSGSRLLINERLDVAVAAGADGIHLTSSSFGAAMVRRAARSDFLIGVSTHSMVEVRSAKNEGADFVVFGPIYKTANKGEPAGLEELKHVVAENPDIPIIGLGGISVENFHEVLAIGSAGIAGISVMNTAEKVEELGRIIYQ